MNGNKSLEDASSPLPKPNSVCDNNYEDNIISANTSNGEQQTDQATPVTHFQPKRDGFNNQERGGRNFRPRDDRRDQEGGAGRTNEYDRGQSGGFKPRGDDRNGSNDQQRRNFDSGRDSRGSDYDRNSSSGRGGRDRNRDNDRRQHDSNDGASENERGAGGRNYQRDSNNRERRSGFDRRKNFNDREDRKPSDEVDKAGNLDGATMPSRGSYQNDRNEFNESRVGYQKRNTAQSRIDGKRSDRLSEQKGMDLNQTVQVSIVRQFEVFFFRNSTRIDFFPSILGHDCID